MLKKLNDFNIGETGQITTVEGEGKIEEDSLIWELLLVLNLL